MPLTLSQTAPVLRRLAEQHGKRLPRVAEWLLTVLIAYSAALLAWKLVPLPQSARWSPPPPAAGDAMAAPRGPDAAAIAAAHLYGQAAAPDAPSQDQIEDAPDTRLNLSLLGILSATVERGSRALIASSDGEEKPYAIGSDVIRGVSLQAIFADRVILSRAGQLETLRLDKDAPSRAPVQTARPAAETPTGSNAAAVLSTIREELLNDPSRANQYIRMQPSSSGGQLRGYRIYPGRDRAVFNAAGLRPGDLVTEVNGIQLNDASTALQMLGQLSSATSLTVVVERGGQPQTVNVNFN